jgi:hypothetical protein
VRRWLQMRTGVLLDQSWALWRMAKASVSLGFVSLEGGFPADAWFAESLQDVGVVGVGSVGAECLDVDDVVELVDRAGVDPGVEDGTAVVLPCSDNALRDSGILAPGPPFCHVMVCFSGGCNEWSV